MEGLLCLGIYGLLTLSDSVKHHYDIKLNPIGRCGGKIKAQKCTVQKIMHCPIRPHTGEYGQLGYVPRPGSSHIWMIRATS